MTSEQESGIQSMSPFARVGMAVGISMLIFLGLLTEFGGFAILVGIILFAVLAFMDRALLGFTMGILTLAMAALEFIDPEKLYGSWVLVAVMGLVALLAYVSSMTSE
jgi:hypothetical protein